VPQEFANPTIYQSLYRRVAFALTSLCILLAALLASIVAAIRFIEDGNASLSVILYSLGTVVVLVVVVAVSAFRVHRWTIENAGVRIEEKPKIPFTGFRRQAFVAFSDVAALRHVESGLDFMIEIVARDGRTYRLMQSYQPLSSGAAPSMTAQSLEAFAAEFSRAAARAGHAPPSITEGLSFWNRIPGLGVLVVMMVFSLGFAGAAAWALWDGVLQVRVRGGEMTAIAILLPVGVGYLFYKSLRRRWRVLRAQPSK
jgi:hypothetical protein